jgi:hypothetical protein
LSFSQSFYLFWQSRLWAAFSFLKGESMLKEQRQRSAPANRRLAEALARTLMAQRSQALRSQPQFVQAGTAPHMAALRPDTNPRMVPENFALQPEPSVSPELLDEIDRLIPNLPEPFAPPPQAPPENPPAPEIKGEFPAAILRQTLDLSPDDIKNIKKVLMTEAVAGLPPEIYRQQAAGIVDTILNRRVHGKWGDSIEAVVNAPYQFSDINGPVAWRRNRRGVGQIGDDTLKQGAGLLASQFVDQYLAQRAGGLRSSVGGHLNYANPYYSDASNLAWIRKLDGPRLGQGRAVHWHGTAQGMTPVDPNYMIRVAPQQRLPFGVEPLPQTRQAPQFEVPPQPQVPNAPAPAQRRGKIHPAILAALIKQNALPHSGIDPEVWKHMTEDERALQQRM